VLLDLVGDSDLPCTTRRLYSACGMSGH
jgi:hypothetical protein